MRSKVIPLVLGFLVLAAGCSSERPTSTGRSSRPPAIRLDPQKVPAEMRDLIPLAEKWGIGDDVERADAVAKATPEEKRALFDAVSARYDQINAWLDTFDESQAMSDEMAAFMYLAEASEEAIGELENP